MGGLVRKENVVSILMQCFITIILVSLQWIALGYSLAFFNGELIDGFVGNFDFAGLSNVGMEAKGRIPHLAFMIFHAMFAIIMPALIVGAVAERIRFSALCLFILLWATFVYDPICHWVWSPNGFLYRMGSLDFAGGTVVHLNAGIAALVFSLFVGERQGYPKKVLPPHNLPFAILGTGFLWVGWFGFNAGSQFAADGRAVNLDVFGIHAINGAWGAIATGFLADAAIGKIAGSAAQTWIQLKAVLITASLAELRRYSFCCW